MKTSLSQTPFNHERHTKRYRGDLQTHRLHTTADFSFSSNKSFGADTPLTTIGETP